MLLLLHGQGQFLLERGQLYLQQKNHAFLMTATFKYVINQNPNELTKKKLLIPAAKYGKVGGPLKDITPDGYKDIQFNFFPFKLTKILSVYL